jgi:nucleotide-binding universal stress UspA family protein
MKKILLPIDGSKESLKAAEYALELASNTAARLDLIHVLPTKLDFNCLTPGGYCPDLDCFEKEYEEDVRKVLNKIVSQTNNVEVTTRVERGNASKVILRLAHRGCYNMIVMGTKAAGPISRLIFGSICNDVIHKAPCPVVVVH